MRVKDLREALANVPDETHVALVKDDGWLRPAESLYIVGSVFLLASTTIHERRYWQRLFPADPEPLRIFAKSSALDPLGLLKRIADNARRREW